MVFGVNKYSRFWWLDLDFRMIGYIFFFIVTKKTQEFKHAVKNETAILTAGSVK